MLGGTLFFQNAMRQSILQLLGIKRQALKDLLEYLRHAGAYGLPEPEPVQPVQVGTINNFTVVPIERLTAEELEFYEKLAEKGASRGEGQAVPIKGDRPCWCRRWPLGCQSISQLSARLIRPRRPTSYETRPRWRAIFHGKSASPKPAGATCEPKGSRRGLRGQAGAIEAPGHRLVRHRVGWTLSHDQVRAAHVNRARSRAELVRGIETARCPHAESAAPENSENQRRGCENGTSASRQVDQDALEFEVLLEPLSVSWSRALARSARARPGLFAFTEPHPALR
jgi:hypothetical protein